MRTTVGHDEPCRACWLLGQPIDTQRSPEVMAQWRARPAQYCPAHQREVRMMAQRMQSIAHRMAESVITPRQVREDMTGVWGMPW